MVPPRVILNAAMTVDGKISTRGGDSKISCEEDLDRVHQLRAEVDAVMVGIGTVKADDPLLTVRRAEGENPTRVIVDSRASISPEANVLDESSPTIMAISENARSEDRERLHSLGAQIIVAGGERVDLKTLMKRLVERGIKTVLLEGGSTLNWSMLKQGLVDEIRVAVRPSIVGGEKAKTLVGGTGFEKVSDGIDLKLVRGEDVGSDLLLVYEVEEYQGDQKNRG